MAPRGVCDIDTIQPAAWRPKAGPPCLVIQDPKRELAVVIIDLLCACHTVEVQGQEVPVVNLERAIREEGENSFVQCCAF